MTQSMYNRCHILYSNTPSELSKSPRIKTSFYYQPKHQETLPRYDEVKEDHTLNFNNNETSVNNSEMNDMPFSNSISPQKQHEPIPDTSLRFSEKYGSFGGQNQYKFKQNEVFRKQPDHCEISNSFSSNIFSKPQQPNNLPDISRRPALQNEIEFHHNSAFEPINSSKAANLSCFEKPDGRQVSEFQNIEDKIMNPSQNEIDRNMDTRNEVSYNVTKDPITNANSERDNIAPHELENDRNQEIYVSTGLVRQEVENIIPETEEEKLLAENHEKPFTSMLPNSVINR